MYRKGYSSIDVFNKISVGRHSITDSISTYSDWKTCFVALLSMSVTNAYNAFIRCNPVEAEKMREQYKDVDSLS